MITDISIKMVTATRTIAHPNITKIATFTMAINTSEATTTDTTGTTIDPGLEMEEKVDLMRLTTATNQTSRTTNPTGIL